VRRFEIVDFYSGLLYSWVINLKGDEEAITLEPQKEMFSCSPPSQGLRQDKVDSAGQARNSCKEGIWYAVYGIWYVDF